MPLVDDPCEVVVCESGCCGDCGADLTGAQGSACRGDRSPMSGRHHLHRAGSGAVRPRGVGPGVENCCVGTTCQSGASRG